MKELKTEPRMLLVGIGNYEWGDYSLGWTFVDLIVSQGYESLDYEFRHKLKAEDAELIAGHEVVVFVQASKERLNGGFEISPCIAANHPFYTEHGHAPAAILHLTQQLYNKMPKAYIISISGTEWGLDSFLSREGNKNMEAAIEYFTGKFLPEVMPVEPEVER